MYVQIIPSRVGSGVEVRQTWAAVSLQLPSNSYELAFSLMQCESCQSIILRSIRRHLRCFSQKYPKQSMGMSSTVRFRVTAAQDPAGPQSVGGLDDSIEPTSSDPQGSLTYTEQPRDLRKNRWRCSCAFKVCERSPAIRSGKVLSTLMFSTGAGLNTQSEHTR